ncbi:C2H2-type zinc finger protein [Streptomyces sp. NPDC018693]|uniref:C2H2-type zinc finger protein n=1 Tax=unclassified Streptomyces TaxID=2593676 RepID=UPI0037B663D8
MPPELIHVRPTPALRRDFAMWAVAQTPKVRTVSTTTFAVPAKLFTEVPEPLLIGATVDGHRFVSPLEDEANGTPPPGELLGVATPETFTGAALPEREGIPGQPLPPVPDEAYPPDAEPLPEPDFAPLEDAPADGEGSDSSDRTAEQSGPYCAECDRPFKSDRALNSHRRQAHPED